MVAEEIEARAVEGIASGARDYVHRASIGNPRRKIEICGRESEIPALLPERSPSVSRKSPRP